MTETQSRHTAPDSLRTDRLLAVQCALLSKIDELQAQEACAKNPLHRDETLHWERIHLASSARIAKDMAVARGCDPELSAIACSLHDIGRILTGKQKNHAAEGKQPARRLLEKLRLFTEEEIHIISNAVAHHSDKSVIGSDIEEIIKDADVVDCYEYGMELPRPEQKRRYERYLSERLSKTKNADAPKASAPASEKYEGSPACDIYRYLNLLRLFGADDARLIDPKQVVTAPFVRFKCQYGCSFYGKNLCCPPHTPDDIATRSILDCYSTAILFRKKQENTVSAIAHKVMRQLFLDGYYKAAAFGSGVCRLCEECDLTNCRFPNQAVPSMEACGIDVFATASHCGYELFKHPDDFFGLLLVE